MDVWNDSAGILLARAGPAHPRGAYPQEVNDISIMARKNLVLVDNFDEMLEQAIDTPLVMGIALHPYLSANRTASEWSEFATAADPAALGGKEAGKNRSTLLTPS